MSKNVESPEALVQRSVSDRAPGLRLKELMTFVIVLALACYFWGFFKSTQAQVSYQSFEVFEDKIQDLEGDWNQISSSPYRWQYLTKEQLAAMRGGSPTLYRKRSRLVSKWSQEYLDGYEHTGQGNSNNGAGPLVSLGRLHGLVGARKAGDMLQMRIDLSVTHQQMEKKNRMKATRIPEYELAGTIHYEGYAPKQYLMFAAPLKESVYHVLVFEAKNWEGHRG